MTGIYPYVDRFDRVDEGSPPSASWTDGIQAFVDGLAVRSRACTQENAAGAFRQGSYWNAADFGPDLEMGCKLFAWTDTTNNELWMFSRLANIGAGTTDGYSMRFQRVAGATNWYLSRYDNAAGTALAGPVTQAVAAGDWIRFELFGSKLRGLRLPLGGKLWQPVISAEDSTYLAAGKSGFEVTNNTETAFQEFWAYTAPPAPIVLADYRRFPKHRLRTAA